LANDTWENRNKNKNKKQKKTKTKSYSDACVTIPTIGRLLTVLGAAKQPQTNKRTIKDNIPKQCLS
jgi:hypothetical protein